jgi:hypothetical protein
MTLGVLTLLGTVVAALIAGVISLLEKNKDAQGWVSKILVSKDKKDSDPILTALTGNIKLEELTSEFTKFPGVKKAVIVRTTNGGSIPVVGSTLYSSIAFPHVWAKTWNNQKLDPEYSKLVLDVYMNDYISFSMDELDKDGLLVTLFNSQSVTFCECYSLKKMHEAFFFLAIDYYDHTLSNVYVENEIRILINEIRTIINGN